MAQGICARWSSYSGAEELAPPGLTNWGRKFPHALLQSLANCFGHWCLACIVPKHFFDSREFVGRLALRLLVSYRGLFFSMLGMGQLFRRCHKKLSGGLLKENSKRLASAV